MERGAVLVWTVHAASELSVCGIMCGLQSLPALVTLQCVRLAVCAAACAAS